MEQILVKFGHRLQKWRPCCLHLRMLIVQFTMNIHLSRRFIVAGPFSKWIPHGIQTKLIIAIPLSAANGLAMRCDERLQYHPVRPMNVTDTAGLG